MSNDVRYLPSERTFIWLAAGMFSLWFVFIYGGASFLSAYVPWRVDVAFSFERYIPFVPEWSWIYVSMPLMLLCTIWVGRRLETIFPLFVNLSGQVLLAAIFFSILPVTADISQRHSDLVVFWLADFLNMERNFLPSLHVSLAATAGWFCYRLSQHSWRWLWLVWAGLITLSTLGHL